MQQGQCTQPRCVTHAVARHSCCLRRDVLRAAVCCHVRVLQCAVMNACSHPLTHHAVQIAVSHCRAGRSHINSGFLLFIFNDREHRPANGQPAEVEAVLAQELLRGGHCFYTGDSFQYKLKWKGWSVREATWEPESNCVALGVEEMTRSFDDQHPIRGQSTLFCGNGQVLDSYTNLDIETSY